MLGMTSVSTGLGGDHHVSSSSHHRQSFAAPKLGEFTDINAVGPIECRGLPPGSTIVMSSFHVAIRAFSKIPDI